MHAQKNHIGLLLDLSAKDAAVEPRIEIMCERLSNAIP